MARYGNLKLADLEPVGPGTPAGRYFRLFWHPVFRAKDLLPGKARPIEILSEKFTLYRGEGGAPHVTSFRCPHRGTQLSLGCAAAITAGATTRPASASSSPTKTVRSATK
jgi:hypothetical protein